MKNFFLLFLIVLIVTACSSVPRFSSRSERFRPEYSIEKYSHYNEAAVLETETGIASYYADKYHGRITYSGEVYDMYSYSAAHPFYQMGTIIRVINNANGKRIIIPINDRMPYRSDRIIDLSYGTAEELEMINVGITEVTVEVLEWGKGRK